jgi:hypothetical protein
MSIPVQTETALHLVGLGISSNRLGSRNAEMNICISLGVEYVCHGQELGS